MACGAEGAVCRAEGAGLGEGADRGSASDAAEGDEGATGRVQVGAGLLVAGGRGWGGVEGRLRSWKIESGRWKWAGQATGRVQVVAALLVAVKARGWEG
jgi:hypothetical protein